MSTYTNNEPEEDERKFAIGGSVGCLTFIVLAFIAIVITFIFMFILNSGRATD